MTNAPSLIELSVDVDPVLADALSVCLFEAGAEGVEERDEADGPRLVTYCPDIEHADRLRLVIEEFRERAAIAFPEASLGPVRTAPADGAWTTAWLDALGPVRLTDEFVLRPTRCQPAPEGEATLWYEPAACFGSGEHPTTCLAARALQRELRARAPGATVLDVGTGNGVLCLVAARCGASAVGIDIDAMVVDAARRNAELNQLSSRCTFSTTPVDGVEGRYDVVVANIDAPTLCSLARSLSEHLAPGGSLLLTGLLEEQADELSSAFAPLGIELGVQERDDDWVLLVFSERAP